MATQQQGTQAPSRGRRYQRKTSTRQQGNPSEASKRRRGVKMTEKRLLSAIDYREERADSGDAFEDEQRRALRYYFGEPFGNENPDQSKIVMREVYAVIEWIKPMLMKVFFGSEKVLEFTPNSADDVKQAEQETKYINHVVQQRNDGFLIFMSWFTDALLLKNGYVLAYYDERVDVSEDTYEGVDADTLSLLMEERDIEILEQEIDGADEFGSDTYTLKLRTKTDKGRVCIRPMPPERIKIDAAHESVSLKEARYVRYRERQTISSLRELGFDVPDDIADGSDKNDEHDRLMETTRRQRTSRYDPDKDDDDPDMASREVDVDTCWIRIDFDGDGIAELRRVIKVGSTVLYNEVDGMICLVSLTPTIIAHRHQGMSIADAVMDIQEIKSMLARGYIDNIFLANNGRYFIDEDRVNLDDMLVSRPGGVVRVEGGVANAVQPFQHPILGTAVIQSLEYMDNVLENRTGASPRVLQGQSFDGNAINKTATGINTIMSSVMSRIELIARIFAETGVRDLYMIVHGLTLKHNRKQDVFELLGEYVPVDVRTWETREQMTIHVGLGSGDKTERIQGLQMLITAQQSLMAMGLCGPDEIYNSLAKLTELIGFKDIQSFWKKPQGEIDPATGKPGPAKLPAPPQDPKVMADQAKLAADDKARQADAEIKARGIEADFRKAQMADETAQLKLFVEQQVKIALAGLQSDDANAAKALDTDTAVRTSKQGARAEVEAEMAAEGPKEPPATRNPELEAMVMAVLQKISRDESKPKRVVHIRDANNRIVESRLATEEE